MMPRYLVRHRVTRLYASQDELIADWAGLSRRTHPGARWLNSWWAAGTAALTCEWEAESPDAIRACFLAPELEMAPIEQVEEVVALDPSWLDEAGVAGSAAAPPVPAPEA
jgi:hypothetical protein